MPYVYILQSEVDPERFYTGLTTDPGCGKHFNSSTTRGVSDEERKILPAPLTFAWN